MSRKPRRDYSEQKRKSYSRYRVRCRYCLGRRTLTKLPEFYVKPPKCTCAGARKAHEQGVSEWSIDWHRTAKFEAKATTCRCGSTEGGKPHRKGSTWNSGRCDHAKPPADETPPDFDPDCGF